MHIYIYICICIYMHTYMYGYMHPGRIGQEAKGGTLANRYREVQLPRSIYNLTKLGLARVIPICICICMHPGRIG